MGSFAFSDGTQEVAAFQQGNDLAWWVVTSSDATLDGSQTYTDAAGGEFNLSGACVNEATPVKSPPGSTRRRIAQRPLSIASTCRLKAKVTTDTMVDVLTTGVGWWSPDAAAPHFGARDININAAMSYSAATPPFMRYHSSRVGAGACRGCSRWEMWCSGRCGLYPGFLPRLPGSSPTRAI